MDDRLDVDKPASSVPGNQLGNIVSPELVKIEQDEIENVEPEEENRLESVIEIKEEVITSESVLETIGNVDSLGGTSISDKSSRFELKLRIANELEAQKTENPDLNRVSEKLNLKFYVVKKLWQAMRQYYRKNKKLACAGHNASIVRCRECPLFTVMNVLVPKFDGDEPYNEHAPIRTKIYNEGILSTDKKVSIGEKTKTYPKIWDSLLKGDNGSSECGDCGFHVGRSEGELLPCNHVDKTRNTPVEKEKYPGIGDGRTEPSSNANQQQHFEHGMIEECSCSTQPNVYTHLSVKNEPEIDSANAVTKDRISSYYASDDESCFMNANDGSDIGLGTQAELINSGTKKTSNNMTKKETRKRDVAERRRLAHAVILENCGCSKVCSNLVSIDDRINMHKTFWSLDAAGRKHFVRERAQRKAVKKRRDNFSADENLRKHHSYDFHIRTRTEAQTVCRKFFLNTLGYGEQCGNIIYRMVVDQAGSSTVKRGKYERSTEKRCSVKAHIAKYNLCIPQSNVHTPNRFNLPSDLSAREMHQNYTQTHDDAVSYSFYCRMLRDLNISIVKMGHEECETCVSASQHQETSGHSEENPPLKGSCALCEGYREHQQLTTAARWEYRENGDSIKSGHIVMAVDLNKVIHLPRLDGLQSVVIAQRLIAFNKVFAPVGKYTRSTPVVACLWNESVNGSSSDDIAACFHRVITRFGDFKKLVLWLNYYEAQENKNWNLFLHLILLINSKNIQLKEIIIKKFEPGHAVMAADSFHTAVEGAMRRKPPITYPDLRSAVASAKEKVDVLDMLPEHFFSSVFHISQYALDRIELRPCIDNMRYIAVKKGSLNLHYSSSVNGENLQCRQVFTAKQEKLISAEDFDLEKELVKKSKPQGVDAVKKVDLLKTILPLVDGEKKDFWMKLPQADENEN